jgi:hypothetical protein
MGCARRHIAQEATTAVSGEPDAIKRWTHFSPGNREMDCCSVTPIGLWLA